MSQQQIDLEFIRLKNFRSVLGPEEIPLQGLKGLYQIRGKNLDTGGSSGCGKSTVNLAISHALGYCPFPATELQSWLTEAPLNVDLGLKTPEHQLVVSRGGPLKLQLDGETIKGGAKAADAELRRLLGLTPAMLKALTYRQQGSKGTFLSKTNIQIQEFFTEVLGLDRFERAVAASDENRKALQQKTQQLQGKLDLLKQQLHDAEQHMAMTESQTRRVDDAPLKLAVQEAKKALEELQVVQKAIGAKRHDYQESMWSTVTAATQDLNKEVQALRALFETKRKEFYNSLSSEGLKRVLQNDLPARKKKLEAKRLQGAGACPQCERPWDDEEHQRAFQLELAREDADIKSAIANAELQLVEALKREEDLIQLGAVVQRAEEAFKAKAEEARRSFDANLQALKAADQDIGMQVSLAMDRYNAAQTALSRAQQENQRLEAGLKARLEQVMGLRMSLALEDAALQKSQAGVFAEQDFAAMVGREGFLGAIFDEVLQEVAQEANDIMARVPNIAEVTLRFRSESITGKGTVQRAITPVVNVRGHEAQLESGCSGGMLGAVYLATDLAVIDVVSRRLGVSPGWLVLDESFEGLGPVEKEGYLEVLQAYADRKLVLVVDHGTETKEYFRNGIDLVFEKEVTRIQPRKD